MNGIGFRSQFTGTRRDGNCHTQILTETGLALVKTDDITIIIFIVRHFRPGNIIAHGGIQIFKAVPSGVMIRLNADIKGGIVIQMKFQCEAVRGNLQTVFPYIRVKVEYIFRNRIDPDFHPVDNTHKHRSCLILENFQVTWKSYVENTGCRENKFCRSGNFWIPLCRKLLDSAVPETFDGV